MSTHTLPLASRSTSSPASYVQTGDGSDKKGRTFTPLHRESSAIADFAKTALTLQAGAALPVALPNNTAASSSTHNFFQDFPISPPPEAAAQEIHYLLCNELQQTEMLSTLAQQPRAIAPLFHIGFSCWYNLDIIAQRRSDAAILCDIDPRMFYAYQVLKKTIEESSTPEIFAERLYKDLETALDNDFHGLLDVATYHNLTSFKKSYLNRGWLKDQPSYDHIRSMVQSGKLAFLEFDISAPRNQFAKVKEWILDKGHVIDTIYTSNIAEWLHNSSSEVLNHMLSNIESLCNNSTLVISAQRRRMYSGGPELKIEKGLQTLSPYETRAQLHQLNAADHDGTNGSFRSLNFNVPKSMSEPASPERPSIIRPSALYPKT